MAHRGRPCRAGEPATHRVSFWLTPIEHSTLRRLAQANDVSMADAVRLGLFHLSAQLDEGDIAPMLIGNVLVPVESGYGEPIEFPSPAKKRRLRD